MREGSISSSSRIASSGSTCSKGISPDVYKQGRVYRTYEKRESVSDGKPLFFDIESLRFMLFLLPFDKTFRRVYALFLEPKGSEFLRFLKQLLNAHEVILCKVLFSPKCKDLFFRSP